MSTWCGPGCSGSLAGAAAAPPVVLTAGDCGVGVSTAACGSGSRMSAPSPRPSAFLSISDYLLGQLRVSLSAPTIDIIENNRLTKAWCFRKTHIARNHALKYLRAKKTAQVRGYLTRERCALRSEER